MLTRPAPCSEDWSLEEPPSKQRRDTPVHGRGTFSPSLLGTGVPILSNRPRFSQTNGKESFSPPGYSKHGQMGTQLDQTLPSCPMDYHVRKTWHHLSRSVGESRPSYQAQRTLERFQIYRADIARAPAALQQSASGAGMSINRKEMTFRRISHHIQVVLW